MFQPPDIRPLTEFQREAKAHIARLKKTGKPEILTVNGRAAVVVQDASSYQKLRELADRARDIAAIETALADVKAGKVQDFESFASDSRKALQKLPKKRKSA